MTPREVFDAIVQASLGMPRCGLAPPEPPDPAIAERESRITRDPLAFLPIIERALEITDPELLDAPEPGALYLPLSPAQQRVAEARAAAKLLKFMPVERRDALIASHFSANLTIVNRLTERFKALRKTANERGDDAVTKEEQNRLACKVHWFGDRCNELVLAAEDSVSPVLIEPVFKMLEDAQHQAPNYEVATQYLEYFPARYPELQRRLKATLVKLGKHATGEYAITKAIEWMEPHYPKFPQPAKK